MKDFCAIMERVILCFSLPLSTHRLHANMQLDGCCFGKSSYKTAIASPCQGVHSGHLAQCKQFDILTVVYYVYHT